MADLLRNTKKGWYLASEYGKLTKSKTIAKHKELIRSLLTPRNIEIGLLRWIWFALRVLLKERLTSASIGVVTLERNIADEVYFAVETNHCTRGKIISYRYIPAGLHPFVGNVLKQNPVIEENLKKTK